MSDRVKLVTPKDWKSWNHRFISEATRKNLWGLINPDSPRKGQFVAEPTKPRPQDYPKRLIRQGQPVNYTPSGSMETLEEIDEDGQPFSYDEMTTQGLGRVDS